MIIENPDVFKSWLTSILEPLCDADPAALAKYVYALVKKEKPVEELREGMLDQLDVFLQQETKPFVEMLFKSLETNEYLANVAESEPMETRQPSEAKEAPSEVQEEPSAPETAGQPSPPHRVVVSRTKPTTRAPPMEQTLVKVLPTELLEEPIDDLPRRRDRRIDLNRDKDDRRRNNRWQERRGIRRRRSPLRQDHKHDNRRLPTSRSPSPSPRRYRNRSPPLNSVDRPLSKSRSRSRSPLPRKVRVRSLREMELERERDRDRMSRDRDRVSRDREHRERDRSRDRSRSLTPIRDDRLSPVHYKRRCRDFDEKGYCMRGDLCQWDHGADPVVLEDATLSRGIHLPTNVPEYNPLAPNIWPGAPFTPFVPPPPRELVPIPRVMQPAIPRPPPRHPAPNKKPFDGYRPPGARMTHPNMSNCSLEVKKVPRGLNDITHLNNHFGKFGKIVNIQVCFEGDPEAALITFSSHTEANVAYKSTEAVLNNRFIKVFWHNPESKQENVPPNQVPAAKPERAPNQHPSSHNKVLINKDNIKATADSKVQEKVVPTPIPPITPIVATVNPSMPSHNINLEMHKRAQALLHTQLQQQNLLIQKLESGQVTGPQKVALMEAINSAQEGIEKLRKELVAYNKTIRQVQASAKKPKTREEAQKEILDAELDMFTKQQEGQDVTELVKRIAELRRQMAMQFPVHNTNRRTIHASRGARFNSATRFVRNGLNATTKFNHQSVDHRPRALLISGFESEELDALVKHFSQFGEITGREVNMAVPEVILQYKVRSFAEQALARGRNFNERTLTITWVTNNKPITPVAQSAITTASTLVQNGTTSNDMSKNNGVDANNQDSQPEALTNYDEEDDEDEDRSWRR